MSDDPDLVEGKFKAIKDDEEDEAHEDEAHAEEDEKEDDRSGFEDTLDNWQGA